MSDIDDGGPAFPVPGLQEHPEFNGATLRDFFATSAPADEIANLTYHSLSRMAQEKLIGCPFPKEPPPNECPVDYQIAKMNFYAAVSAKLRFIHADFMLEARKS